MSNHSAGYIVSEILWKLDRKGIFNNMSKEEAGNLIVDIASVVNDYDGNIAEALEGTGEKYGVCYYCEKYSPNGLDEDGLCPDCQKKF